MPKRQHQPLAIDHIFRQKQFDQIEQGVNQHQDIHNLGAKVLAEFNLNQCHASKLEQGKITIEAPTAVWLTRLKQFRFELLSHFRQHHPEVISLDLKLNPKLNSKKTHSDEVSKTYEASGKVVTSEKENIEGQDVASRTAEEIRKNLAKLIASNGER